MENLEYETLKIKYDRLQEHTEKLIRAFVKMSKIVPLNSNQWKEAYDQGREVLDEYYKEFPK